MAIRTRLTETLDIPETLDIRVPIILAPMGRTSGGALAACFPSAILRRSPARFLPPAYD